MIKLHLEETKDYQKLVDFFIKNDLEFDEGEGESTNYIKAYQVTHGGDIVGAIALSLTEGEYVISGIAVDPIYRKMKLGKMMLEKIITKTLEMGADHIVLVARAPEFFKKFGFEQVPKSEEPAFFSCVGCPQNGTSCFPEVLKLQLK